MVSLYCLYNTLHPEGMRVEARDERAKRATPGSIVPTSPHPVGVRGVVYRYPGVARFALNRWLQAEHAFGVRNYVQAMERH
jgi:hypothetical protein